MIRPPGTIDESWRDQPLERLFAGLGTSAGGLTDAEAARRLARDGPATLTSHRRRALVLRFLARFGDPLMLLLLGAAAMAAISGDRTSAIVVGSMVLMSVTLDFVQETRAGRAAEALQRSVALRVRVRRDGATVERAAETLVCGDVVELSAGALVPADGRLLEAHDCFVNQALLTGEPYPVEKHALADPGAARAGAPAPAVGGAPADAAPIDTSDAAPPHAAYMGTSVVSGSASLLVAATGRATVFGRIGERLATRPPATSFELGIRRFGLLILRIALLMVVFVLVVNAAFHRPWLESLLFATALAVGLTPELLPMVVSVTLARGALEMSKRKVVVKRLAAIHDLGSMDVLCTDKTGTLTEAKIRLERHEDLAGRESARVLVLACLNSRLESGIRTPLDEAILAHTEVRLEGWSKIDEVPFDFERRRVSVLVDDGTRRLLVLKGALEDVLARCVAYELDDAPAGPPAATASRLEATVSTLPLDAAARAHAMERFHGFGDEGFRVLGLAWKEVPRERMHCAAGDEADLVLAGFAAFEDPPKASAGAAVRALAAAGVSVRIVSGDDERVTRHVCRQLGLSVRGLLTGGEITGLDDSALLGRVEETDLFCRVTPAQKDRVILALRRRGHVVGYLGDGINDAPSLHSADVGLSVEGAADVAREAADLILLESDLMVLYHGVLEGRRTFGNIMKYVMMGTSSNFGNMFSMAGGALLLPFLPMLPAQILLNNFLYDVSEIPIPLDRVDPDMVARPHRWDMKQIQGFMLVVGPVSSLFDFLTFFLLLRVFHAGEALFHTGWFVESLATQVLVIFVIRTRGAPWKSRPSAVLLATSLGVVGVAVALPFMPFARALGFVPPPPAFFAALVGMVLVYLVLVEWMKRGFYRRVAA